VVVISAAATATPMVFAFILFVLFM